MTAASRSGRPSPVLAPAVTITVVTLLAVVGFAAQWYAAPSVAFLWMVVWDLVVGAGFGAAGCVVTIADRGSTAGRLLLLAAVLLLAAPTALAAGQPNLARAFWLAVVAVVVPLVLLRVVGPRPLPRLMRVFDLVVVVLGVVAAVSIGVDATVVADLATTAAAVVALCAGWLLFELTAGDQRRRLLWTILGVSVSVPTTLLLLLAMHGVTAGGTLALAIVMAALSLAFPLTVAIALTNPRVVDVREVIHRVAVLSVTLALAAALYAGADATLELIVGSPPARAVRVLLAMAVAAGFHPMMMWLRTAIAEMLFGGRADPVDTLTRLGPHLTGGSSPPEWLDTLRGALGVPGIALRQGSEVLATSGQVGHAPTAVTPLYADAEHVGDLVVALPVDHLRLPPTTSAVLNLVAAPLAQNLHAARLTEALRTSQSRLVTALEEERRRMRRDLHDGLGPTLTGIAYSADAAANLVPPQAAQALEILRQLRTDASDAIAEIRRIVYGLRPKALDELGLIGAVRQRTSHLRSATGTALIIDITAPADLPDLPAAVEVTAYRVAVEAVTNVARHAGVPTAEINFARPLPGVLRVEIRDRGHTPGRWRPGAGLESMRERVEQIGGTFSITTGPAGSIITADMPLHAPPVGP